MTEARASNRPIPWDPIVAFRSAYLGEGGKRYFSELYSIVPPAPEPKDFRRMDAPRQGDADAVEPGDADKRTWRFARSLRPLGGGLEFLGPKAGRFFALYKRVSPPRVWRTVSTMLHNCGAVGLGEAGLTAYLKEVGGYYKRWGEAVSGDWKWFVNMEECFGYREPEPVANFVREVREWAGGSFIPVHPLTGKSEDFYRVFRAGVREFLSDFSQPTGVKSVADWVADPGGWGGSGSTQWRGAVSLQGVVLKRNKWSMSLTRPQAEILSLLYADGPELASLRQRNKAIAKREKSKVRPVINSDDELYLRMSYVSSWLERGLSGNSRSTLFMSSEQRLAVWRRLSADDGAWRLPLDQSRFDWHVNKSMLGIINDEIYRLASGIPDASVRADVERVLRQISSTIANGGSISFPGTSETVEVEKGVMSGWRWTALYDTIVNWAELWVARDAVKSLRGRDGVVYAVAQGDDDMLHVADEWDVVLYPVLYARMGLDVNPGKFFASRVRDEFLRQVGRVGQGSSGYPVRALGSVLWRNPLSADPPNGDERGRELLHNWAVLKSRGGNVEQVMRADLGQALGISRELLEDWLSTPAAVGGPGWGGSGSRNAVAPETRVTYSGVLTGVDRSVPFPMGRELGLRLAVGLVDKSNVRGEIVRNEWRVMDPERPARVALGTTRLPTRPRVSDRFPHFLRGAWLEHLVRERDWGAVGAMLECGPAVADSVRSRVGNGLFGDWVLGKLSMPRPEGVWHPDAVNAWLGLNEGWLVGRLLEGDLGRGWLRRAWLALELRLGEGLADMGIAYIGM